MSNQASKDELENLIRNNIHTFADEYLELDECVDAIQALIRTEKLKLLAEVGERVIGEDYDIPAEMEKVGRDFQKLDTIAKTGGLLNKFKADLRAELTKMEAEL